MFKLSKKAFCSRKAEAKTIFGGKLKKGLALFVAVGLSVTLLNVNPQTKVNSVETEENQGYYTYDIATETQTYHEFPEVDSVQSSSTNNTENTENTAFSSLEVFEGPSITPMNIILQDGRTRVTNPSIGHHQSICFLKVWWGGNSYTRATGFLRGTSNVVTSGHVLYDESRGGWAHGVEVSPAYNGNGVAPKGTKTGSSYMVSSGWMDSEDSGKDWGIITLNGHFMGDYMAVTRQSGTHTNEWVTVSGYPVTYNNQNTFYMYEDSDTVFWTSSEKVSYFLDMSDGQSGAPVYRYTDSMGYTVIAINCGSNDLGLNYGVRLSTWLYNYLMDIV
jgi:glutamyl endopeptidase